MKIKNIFKKSKKEVKASNVQKLNEKELEKISGGATEWWGTCSGQADGLGGNIKK